MWFFKQSLINLWNLHLPVATGPYMPGYTDVMLGYNKEDPFFRLFYPTTAKKNAKENVKRYTPWVQDDDYLVGFARVFTAFITYLLPELISKYVVYVFLNTYLLRILFSWTIFICIPALYGVRAKTDEKLKCIVMSHGLGASRFLYSNICCELASRGFLVASLEHRDLSACSTYYYASREDASIDKRTPLYFRYIEQGSNHYEERNEQIKIRSQECSKVLDFLININKGIVPYNIMNVVPSKLGILFDFADLEGMIDIDSFTIMGHSFGAATALYSASKRKEFKHCILLDPWMFPIKNENVENILDQPLLFINTQTFHNSSNVNAMSKFLIKDNREMFTLKHTTHENQTDSVLLWGYWLNWFMKKLDPQEALRINNALILKFLNRYVGCPADVEEEKLYLEKQAHNIEIGLTTPWV